MADEKHSFLIAGTGEVVEPDDGILAIGSGGPYALAAARAIIGTKTKMTAEEIVKKSLLTAAEICIYTNENITVEKIK